MEKDNKCRYRQKNRATATASRRQNGKDVRMNQYSAERERETDAQSGEKKRVRQLRERKHSVMACLLSLLLTLLALEQNSRTKQQKSLG